MPGRLDNGTQMSLLFGQHGRRGDLERIDFAVSIGGVVDDSANDFRQRVLQVILAHQFHVGFHGLGGQRVAAESQMLIVCKNKQTNKPGRKVNNTSDDTNANDDE